MKLLYISPNSELGGAERILDILIRHHNKKNFEIFVLLMRPGPLEEKWKSLGVKVLRVPEFRFRKIGQLIQAQLALRKILIEHQIDLIHSTMAYGHLFAGPVAWSMNLPEVWFQHGPVGKTLDRWAGYIPTQLILCNSKFTESCQRQLGNSKTSVVYGPVEIPQLSLQNTQIIRSEFRKKYSISESEFLCIHVARLDIWKGQENFIQAVDLARKENPKIRALIVGGSALGQVDYENKLKALVKEKKMEDIIGFTGFINTVRDAYSAADVFVHCSTQAEPLGLSILEALAEGCPVIAADCGGPLEIIKNNESGILCSSENISQMSQAILKISEQTSFKKNLQLQGFKRAQAFEAALWVQRIETCYLSVLS